MTRLSPSLLLDVLLWDLSPRLTKQEPELGPYKHHFHMWQRRNLPSEVGQQELATYVIKARTDSIRRCPLSAPTIPTFLAFDEFFIRFLGVYLKSPNATRPGYLLGEYLIGLVLR